jgi:magnesium-protoporphyrin O-methyltransferase
MNGCCPHARSAGRLFSLFAGRSKRRFARKGFEPSQRQLLVGLEQAGFSDAELLEVGCGVGHLHQTLLERGARSAVGIDLAPQMLREAERWARQRGLDQRVEYLEDDFVTMDRDLRPADITLLDKVVCCYPDAAALVDRSLSKTRRVYALTLPRDRRTTRVGAVLAAWIFKLLGSDFRPYVHDPPGIEGRIRRAGFEKIFEDQTTLWLSQVYLREARSTICCLKAARNNQSVEPG